MHYLFQCYRLNISEICQNIVLSVSVNVLSLFRFYLVYITLKKKNP